MQSDQYLVHKAVALAVTAALGGYAIPAFSADAVPTYTYCVAYPTDPGCPGYVPPAPKAAAPTPAAAPAPEQPKDRTVVVAEPGPPPNKAGECYTKVMLPAEWRSEPTQQMVRAAGERAEYSEPVYQDAEERVLVKPASKKVTVVPAEYAQVEEKVLVREAYRREIEVPALYNTYFDKVMEKPARDVWKPGRGTVEKVDPTTGEILCLVHEDATYKTVERKELFRAASKRYEDVPAEYATVKKTVLKTPESVKEVEVPAEYQTIKVRKLVKAPEPVKVPVDAQYATVNKQVMVAPEHAVWTQVLCIDNSSPAKIQEVKRALNKQGASPTLRTDGEIDPELTNARPGVPAEERPESHRADDRGHAREIGRAVEVTGWLESRIGGSRLAGFETAPAFGGCRFSFCHPRAGRAPEVLEESECARPWQPCWPSPASCGCNAGGAWPHRMPCIAGDSLKSGDIPPSARR